MVKENLYVSEILSRNSMLQADMQLENTAAEKKQWRINTEVGRQNNVFSGLLCPRPNNFCKDSN